MDQNNLQSELIWKDGVPVSPRFDDPYFSFQDGLAEARHVFLAGNTLPYRFRDGFHVAELGFGTGLNALTTLHAWNNSGQLHFTSFEAHPISTHDMATALSRWPELNSSELIDQWRQGKTEITLGPMRLTVIIGDVRETLPKWQSMADAWFLDGFSPAKNEAMWSSSVLSQVATHTQKGGTFATYTAASHVRQRLTDAGFQVERRPGFGRKRHMTVGVK